MKKDTLRLITIIVFLHCLFFDINAQLRSERSPVLQPYSYLKYGGFSGMSIAESPDPLVSYRWSNPKASDSLQIYILKPTAVFTGEPGSFKNLQSLTGNKPDVTVTGNGSVRFDFGLENAAWVEFDSPDCPGGVEMSISEYNEPGIEKTKKPVKYGNTYRLELNNELYDGVRFAWISVNSFNKEWHITGIRLVCQVKPTNYNGSFSCSDPLLTKIWYMSAYGVKASLCQDYFGSILMDRGDRMSWTGDAHTSQAAALVAFGNYDFIKKNIDNTSKESNGIKSYSLYWVFSLLDYYNYTGDLATLKEYIDNVCVKLDDAYKIYGTNPKLRFYGWDERLCAGFEIWFRPCPEAQYAYKMLSIRAWHEFANVMEKIGRFDLRDRYNGYAIEKITEVRSNGSWLSALSLHSAADAVSTGLLTDDEKSRLFQDNFSDRVNRVSISPFNQYFIINAMAQMGKYDDALSSVRDMWGGMLKYGGTTTFEVYRPSWNDVIGRNDAVPNSQSGIVSLCHPWGSGVVKWLNEEVLGITPTTPGFKTYNIIPHPGRTLTNVSGSTPTPLGTIYAKFDFSAGRFLITSPKGTKGRIGIPFLEKEISRILVNGKLAWDGPFHPVEGIYGADKDSRFVYFDSVNPGIYNISVSYHGITPIYYEPKISYAARYIGNDSSTSGNWGGVYGKEGYVLCNYNADGTDKKSLPEYVRSVEYFRAFGGKTLVPDNTTWALGTNDKRAAAPDADNLITRNATCLSNQDQTMSLMIGINGIHDYRVALYFVDWENTGSRMAVEMFDATTLNLISPVEIVKNYTGGNYLIYEYNKSAKFRINKVRGRIITLSGIFFDKKASDF